jgi:hypothetical protein
MEAIVLKNFLTSSLLGLAVMAMTSRDAMARVCLVFQGGQCKFWSGSVECDTLADQFGGISKNPKVDCEVNASDGLLACVNGGAKRNASPGIQLIHVNKLENLFPPNGPVSIKKSDVTNGIATNIVISEIAGDPLTQLGIDFCPNTNWSGAGYVPCNMDVTVTLSNDSGLLDQVAYHCTLPSCDTLQLVDATTTPVKFERRQYECTLLP